MGKINKTVKINKKCETNQMGVPIKHVKPMKQVKLITWAKPMRQVKQIKWVKYIRQVNHTLSFH